MAKFEENLKKEQERTKDALKRRLEERRRKKKEAEEDKVKKTHDQDEEAAIKEERQKVAALQKEGVRALASTVGSRPRSPPKSKDDSSKYSCSTV